MKTTFPKIDNQPLSAKVKNVLLKMMKDGSFGRSGRLPSEDKLAENLGVSRTVVRDVLASFEQKGFILRRRGIGTMINYHVLNLRNRFDLEPEFMDLIADGGYTPRTAFVNVHQQKANREIIGKLRLKTGEDICVVERLILADEIPAIYCIDYFSSKIILEKDYEEEELKAPIFDFLSQRCYRLIIHDITTIEPICADKKLAGIMDLAPGDPVLHLDKVGYDIEQKPVLCSNDYRRPGILNYTLLRSTL